MRLFFITAVVEATDYEDAATVAEAIERSVPIRRDGSRVSAWLDDHEA
jgi:hypothetical protein